MVDVNISMRPINEEDINESQKIFDIEELIKQKLIEYRGSEFKFKEPEKNNSYKKK